VSGGIVRETVLEEGFAVEAEKTVDAEVGRLPV
jgi:hypothetical protein